MTTKRKYELRDRAERQEATRRRITEATLGLHEEVGPARTTIAEIALRAGVSRPTVYNQFPDDLSLYSACSALFAVLHPPPELTGLELEEALRAQYAFYADNERVLAHVYRDAESLPALAQVLQRVRDRRADAAAELVQGLGANGTQPKRTRAAVTLALEFHTWLSLDRSGLTVPEAAALMAQLSRLV